MIIKTFSADPLEKIKIEVGPSGITHIWLRRNVTEVVEQFDGADITTWTAEEVYYTSEVTPTAADLEENFATLWELHKDDGTPQGDVLSQKIADQEAAILELADLIGGMIG